MSSDANMECLDGASSVTEELLGIGVKLQGKYMTFKLVEAGCYWQGPDQRGEYGAVVDV